jgi:hypothetical protein
MIELGFGSPQPEQLFKFYRKRNRFRKIVAEAVMSIDPSRFDDFPLVKYVVSNRATFFTHLDEILAAMKTGTTDLSVEAAALFSRFFFPMLPFSWMEQFDIPPGIPMFDKYIQSQIEVCSFGVAPVSREICERVVEFWEASRSCDNFFFFVVIHLNITQGQYVRALAPFEELTPSHTMYLHYEMHRIADLDKAGPFFITTIDRMRWPSYTRELLSLFLSPYAPQLSPDLRLEVLKGLPPVFFNLLPEGFEGVSQANFIDTDFEPVEESVLAVQPLAPKLLIRAKSVFRVAPSMAPQVLNFLYKTKSAYLCQYFKSTSPDAAFVEIAEQIVRIMEHEKRYLKDVVLTMNSMLRFTPLVQLFMICISEEFLNAPEFANVFVIFNMFAKKIRMSNDEQMIQNWNDVQDLLNDRLVNKARLEALRTENVLEVLMNITQID